MVEIWEIIRVRGKDNIEDSEPQKIEIAACPLCKAKIPVKVCDDCRKPLMHICTKDTLNGNGIHGYMFHCDECLRDEYGGNRLIKFKIIKM